MFIQALLIFENMGWTEGATFLEDGVLISYSLSIFTDTRNDPIMLP